MLDAYTVAVRVSLNGADQLTTGLMGISRAFAKVHGDATRLQSKLDKIKLSLAAGAAIGGAGALGLAFLAKSVRPASEYAHQLNIINMAGLKQVEVAQAVAAAWRNSGEVMTTSATENLKALLDLRNVLGSMPQAMAALPVVSKVGAVMAASSEGRISNNAQDIAFMMAKALDIIGAARDPQTFAREAGMMSKVVAAFQNRVTPRQYQGVFQYARQAKFDLSDEFKYEILPSLMLEASAGANSLGGGSRGVGPMLAAFYRVTNQGYVNRAALPLLQRLGWINPHTALRTTTQGTTVGPMVEAGLAASNPFIWAMHRDRDIRRVFGENISADRERQIVNQAFRGNQLAAALMVEFLSKPANFRRDQAIIRGAMPYGQAYDVAMKNDPETKMAALRAQWTNVSTQLGLTILPTLISATAKLTEGLRWLGTEMKRHPTLTKTLGRALAGLSVAGVVAGGLIILAGTISAIGIIVPAAAAGIGLLGAAIAAIGAPVLLAIAAAAALGIGLGLLAKHWREIWPAMQKVATTAWTEIQTKMGALWSAITSAASTGFENLKAGFLNFFHVIAQWMREHIPHFMDGPAAPGSRGSPGHPRHPVHPAMIGGTPGRSGVVAPLHISNMVEVHSHTHLNGRQIALTVSEHLAKAVGYQNALGRHDPTATLAAAGAGYET